MNTSKPESLGKSQVLRCENTADFLAALPLAAGFTATNSIFIALFKGRRSSEVLRLDLPDHESDAEVEPVLDGIVELLRRTGAGASGPAIVLTTSQSFEQCAGVPYLKFAKLLQRRLLAEGWRPRELAVVASDGWAGLLSERPALCRPLSEIEASRLRSMSRPDRHTPPSLDRLGQLPKPSPERATQIAKHLKELALRAESGSAHPAGDHPDAKVWVHGVARVAEACFNEAPSAQTNAVREARLTARFIDAAQAPERWLILALTALTRAKFVISIAEGPEAERLDALPVSMQSRESRSWSVEAVLQSLSHESPDPHKLREVVRVCADAASHAPKEQQPAVLALLGWAWWMLGMQSVSSHITSQALAIDPKHELSHMVNRLNSVPSPARLQSLQQRFAQQSDDGTANTLRSAA